MEKILLILRSCSGAGKSSLAKFLIDNLKIPASHYEADQWMMREGKYEFRPERLHYAHTECRNQVENDMIRGVPVIIASNTFTTESEIRPYKYLADKYEYRFVSLVVENRAETTNQHGVSQDVLERQATKLRSSIKLLPL